MRSFAVFPGASWSPWSAVAQLVLFLVCCALFSAICALRTVFLRCAMCGYFLALCTVSKIYALHAVFCSLRCPFWQLPTRVRSFAKLLFFRVRRPALSLHVQAVGLRRAHDLIKHAPGIACFNCVSNQASASHA